MNKTCHEPYCCTQVHSHRLRVSFLRLRVSERPLQTASRCRDQLNQMPCCWNWASHVCGAVALGLQAPVLDTSDSRGDATIGLVVPDDRGSVRLDGSRPEQRLLSIAGLGSDLQPSLCETSVRLVDSSVALQSLGSRSPSKSSFSESASPSLRLRSCRSNVALHSSAQLAVPWRSFDPAELLSWMASSADKIDAVL